MHRLLLLLHSAGRCDTLSTSTCCSRRGHTRAVMLRLLLPPVLLPVLLFLLLLHLFFC
jgi:hypothetical protein